MRILILNDLPVVQAGLRAMLKAPDVRVVAGAQTADEALRLVRARTPDLVLAGVPVGEADGLDLLRRIKAKAPKVSVVTMTTSPSTLYLSRALALGCSGYLLKSVGRQDLLKAIRAIARGECIVEPTVLRELLKEIARQPAEGKAPPAAELTVPEREVLRLISEGGTNREIAQRLGYSVGMVKDYVQRIIEKLGVSDRTQAAVKAVRLGLLD